MDMSIEDTKEYMRLLYSIARLADKVCEMMDRKGRFILHFDEYRVEDVYEPDIDDWCLEIWKTSCDDYIRLLKYDYAAGVIVEVNDEDLDGILSVLMLAWFELSGGGDG